MATIEAPRTANSDGSNYPPDAYDYYDGRGGDENNNPNQKPVGVMQKLAGAVVRFCNFLPASSPEGLSEHFGHASKRNELNPEFTGKVV